MGKKLDIEFIREEFINAGLTPKFEKYCGAYDKLAYECPNHLGIIQYITHNSITKGSGCKLCGFEKMANKNRRNGNDIVKAFIERDLIPLFQPKDYKSGKTLLPYKCKIHNDIIQYIRYDDLIRNHGCAICNESRGEKQIRMCLKQFNIKYITQKKFTDCKNVLTNYKLQFDFYLSDCNLAIEFQGKQHYYPVNFSDDWGVSNQKFEEQLMRDEIKREYCKKNNIDLLEIPYFLYDEIDDVLSNYLNIVS